MNEETHSDSTLELRVRQLKKYMTIGIVVLLIVGLMQFFYTASVKQTGDTALSNAQVQAQTTKDSTICQTFPDDELCKMARQILADPKQNVTPTNGTNGTNGSDGKDGRGVTSFDIQDGMLVVSFTDGSTKNVGRVVGKDGTNGINGTNGADGEDGRGILSSGLENGSLIIRYTDGKTENLGIVVGPAGAPGQAGQPGATGATGAAGQDGQQGPEGPAGISVLSVTVDDTGTVVVQYSNNTSAIAGKVIVNTITSMTCNKDTNILTITVADGTAFTATVDCTPDSLPVPAPTAATTSNKTN